MDRILLSGPDVGPGDRDAILRALDTGWVAPLGPEVDAFEHELATVTARSHAVALSSGTAALHLALLLSGVGQGDRVLVSDLTFAATVNAIRYVGAAPVFVDSSEADWNMSSELLEDALDKGEYAACVPVDLYGQIANYEVISTLCAAAGVPLIADSAEALGARRDGRPAGSWGLIACLSFNGNKIITTSGGGALVTDSEELAERARFLATQARDPAPHYEHSVVGFNYRMSNLLAGLGRSQLEDLDRRVEIRREHNRAYRKAFESLAGVRLMPEASGCRSTFWLTAITIDPEQAETDRESVRLYLDSVGIEARPIWKPMHLQPAFEDFEVFGGGVSAGLFRDGLCLPSGSAMTLEERERVITETLRALDVA